MGADIRKQIAAPIGMTVSLAKEPRDLGHGRTATDRLTDQRLRERAEAFRPATHEAPASARWVPSCVAAVDISLRRRHITRGERSLGAQTFPRYAATGRPREAACYPGS